MIYGSEFKVDVRQLQSTNSPEDLINHLSNRAASELGKEICKNIPLTLNVEKSERRKGADLNNYPSISPSENFKDHYEAEVFAVSRKDWGEFKENIRYALRRISPVEMEQVRNLFIDIESK